MTNDERGSRREDRFGARKKTSLHHVRVDQRAPAGFDARKRAADTSGPADGFAHGEPMK